MREKSGVALKALARELDIDPGFLSRVERGLVSAPEYVVNIYQERFGRALASYTSTLEPVTIKQGSVEYQVTQYALPFDLVLPERSKMDLLDTPQLDLSVSPLFYLSPNPHLGDLVSPGGTLPKSVTEPYSSPISAGKNTYVYDAHTYHTKVPPQGIGLLIDYYTRPGDTVLDPFCGSGMTGVAAVEKGRKAILSDLSPAAAFIAYNLITPIDAKRYLDAIHVVLESARALEHRLYDTVCRRCGRTVPMLYMVWSYGMLCSNCEQEFVLWDVARDERPRVRDSKIKTEFDCPHCGKHLKKRLLKKTQRYPVQVGYKCCGKGQKEDTAPLNEQDLELLAQLEQNGVPANLWYPTDSFPPGVNTKQPISAGITHVDQAYTPRALWAMAYLWDVALRWPDPEVRLKLLWTCTSLYKRVTVFSEFRFWGGSSNSANFNVPAIMNEQNVFRAFERKAKTISWYFGSAPQVSRQLRLSVQSACHLPQIPDKSIDYVFTDPPFGRNINYSEMSFLWESWLRVHTDNTEEAIVNKVQGKDISHYQQLLTRSFSEVRRVLKDDGWLTVIFHNSSARVWESLQRAIVGAGFAIEGTQTFDKKHGTFKQFVSDNAVGYDLVLHCRKSQDRQIISQNSRQSAQRQAAAFIRAELGKGTNQYQVRYLHVAREDEFDYRRLYAEWLADALPRLEIGLSFEEFRAIVDQELQGSTPQTAQLFPSEGLGSD
jgi:DNA modification methylase/DNA-directed RNA polymerase subunit RPC12/RpoP